VIEEINNYEQRIAEQEFSDISTTTIATTTTTVTVTTVAPRPQYAAGGVGK
jgi:hypothetical protein